MIGRGAGPGRARAAAATAMSAVSILRLVVGGLPVVWWVRCRRRLASSRLVIGWPSNQRPR